MVFFTHSVRTHRNYSTSKEVNQLGDEASIECFVSKREENEIRVRGCRFILRKIGGRASVWVGEY